MKDLIDLGDMEREEIEEIYDLTDDLKEDPASFSSDLDQKTLLMLFAKPSTRTRISFETGMTELGGHGIYFYQERSQMSRGESLKDTAKVISRYVDGIMARLYEHDHLLELQENSDVPVINGLTDFLHPCQALADIYTLREKGVELEETSVTFVGDGNNVSHSLMQACAIMGLDFTWSGPQGHEPDRDIIEHARSLGVDSGCSITVMHDPHQAVRGANVIYTDTFVSMGEEKSEKDIERFMHYQVDQDLVEAAGNPHVMHPLPAHRGREITSEVMDSDSSIVYDQAENRLHVQKAILLELLS